ncbi:hypothetical protein [Allocoleopsis sp.]|uniref:hypothetical protein n=1 Tax=Allocoleopsis sp. TaxID=3088169 RepID=UPI002FD3BF4F
MNPRTLKILLEAIAVTACIFVAVGQQSETRITSTATRNTFQKGLNRDQTLLVGQTPTTFCEKAFTTDCGTDEIVEE